MSRAPLPQAAPCPDGTAAQAAEDTERHRQALNELIDMGMDLARTVHAASKAQAEAAATAPAEPATPDPTAAFDRIARCVRRTVLLAQHITRNPAPQRPDPAHAHAAARRQLIRGVEDLIGHNRRGPRAEAMHREFLERLDTPEFIEDIATRPIPELIKEVCNDLGLHNHPGFTPNRRRRPEDLQRLHARAAGHRIPEPPNPFPPDPPAGRPKPPAPDPSPDPLVPVTGLPVTPVTGLPVTPVTGPPVTLLTDLPPALAALLQPP